LCITTPVICIYYVKYVVFADILNPKTSISKIIASVRPVDEWAEIAFSAHQNAENEHCETLLIQVHILNFIIRLFYTRH
jgi:hypothetical protein